MAQVDNNVLIAIQDWFKSNYLPKKHLAGGEVTRLSGKRVVSDEDILSKAQRLAAKPNLEISEFSFVSFKPKVIADNLNNVGVCLGKNDSEVLSSIISIKI